MLELLQFCQFFLVHLLHFFCGALEQESNVNSTNLPAQDFATPAKWSIICFTSYHYHWFLQHARGKMGIEAGVESGAAKIHQGARDKQGA